MPAIAAFFVRQLVIIGVQLGIFALIDNFVTPLLNDAIQSVSQKFGVDESTAGDILHNEFLTTVESLGLTVAFSKARLPLKIADVLKLRPGVTTKKVLPAEVEAKVNAAKSVKVPVTSLGDEGAQATLKTIAAKKGSAFDTVSKVANVIVAAFGVPVGVGLLVTNTIDFGAWSSSAYQTQFQNFLAYFGLHPDEATLKPRTVSQSVFDKVYTALKDQGAAFITNPYTEEKLPFTRENAIKVIDKLGSNILIESGSVSTKQLLAAVLAVVTFNTGTMGAPGVSSTPSAPSASVTTTKSTSTSQSSTTSIKVFTGVVSQGTLGSATSFTPRQDDLIQSVGELEIAAGNNLAPYIASLPGRIIYEIKIVSSILTKTGFRQYGTTQRVQSGTYANGSAKYKTVTNKFAVMKLYILTATGSRSHITDITLGPTDAVNFQPTGADLSAVQTYLQSGITTNSIPTTTSAGNGGGTQNIANSANDGANSANGDTAQQSDISTPQNALQPLKTVEYEGTFVYADTNWAEIYAERGGEFLTAYPYQELYTAAERTALASSSSKFDGIPDRLRAIGVNPDRLQKVRFVDDIKRKYDAAHIRSASLAEVFGAANANVSNAERYEVIYDPATNQWSVDDHVNGTTAYYPTRAAAFEAAGQKDPSSGDTPAKVCTATNLYEYYAALGLPLPPVDERQPTYEQLGLGSGSMYVGTSEQNVKLLAALKKQQGCSI